MEMVNKRVSTDVLDILNKVNLDITQAKKEPNRKIKFYMAIVLSLILTLPVLALDYTGVISIGFFLAIGIDRPVKKTQPSEPIKTNTESTKPKLDDTINGKGVGTGQLDTSSYDEIKAGLQAKTDASYVSYKINVNPVFKDGIGNVLIQNSESNIGLLQVTITSEKSNEIMYKSPVLEPNQFTENGELYSGFKAGTYPALAMFRIYHKETKELLGETGIKVKVTVR